MFLSNSENNDLSSQIFIIKELSGLDDWSIFSETIPLSDIKIKGAKTFLEKIKSLQEKNGTSSLSNVIIELAPPSKSTKKVGVYLNKKNTLYIITFTFTADTASCWNIKTKNKYNWSSGNRIEQIITIKQIEKTINHGKNFDDLQQKIDPTAKEKNKKQSTKRKFDDFTAENKINEPEEQIIKKKKTESSYFSNCIIM